MHRNRYLIMILGTAVSILVLGAAILGSRVRAQTPVPGASPTPSAAQNQRRQQRQQQMQADATQFLNALATNLGISPSALTTAVQNTENQQIAAAVSSGQLTQAEATQLQQRLANGGGTGLFASVQGMIKRESNSIPSNARQAMQSAFSQALGGMAPAQLRQSIQSGQTLSQIAQAHGTTLQAIQTDMVNAAEPVLAQDVQQGQITAAQQQAILSRLQNASSNGSRFGFGGFFGRLGRHGPGPGPVTSLTPTP